MSKSNTYERDPLYVVEPLVINPAKKIIGKIFVWAAFSLMLVLALIQYLKTNGNISFGFETWRPIVYAYVFWGFSIGYSRVLIYGEKGKRSLFVIPAVTVSYTHLTLPPICSV